MARSDFTVVQFNSHFGDKEGDLNTHFPFVGSGARRNFRVEGRPFGPAYLTIQTFDLGDTFHRVRINGRDLPGFDVPQHRGEARWFSWTEVIESGFLREGNNTIEIRKKNGSGDNFLVRSVIVNWRENG